MIDHNPEYEMAARERDQGFADAANQLAKLRDEEWQRYRETQYHQDRRRVEEPKIPAERSIDVVRFERSYYSRLAESPHKRPITTTSENIITMLVITMIIVAMLVLNT